MSIIRHHNHTFSSGIPLSVGDRYYGQDRARDHWHQAYKLGQSMQALFGAAPFLIKLGPIVKGSSYHQINIDPAVAVVNYAVTIPDPTAAWALPPTTASADVPIMVEIAAALTDFDLSTTAWTHDGAATNYLKLAYAETNGNTRSRAKKTGSYAYETIPGYVLSCSTVAPTTYEVALATIIGDDASVLTITLLETSSLVWSRAKVVSSANYALTTTDGVSKLDVSTGASSRTMDFSALVTAGQIGRKVDVRKTDSGAGEVILDAGSGKTVYYSGGSASRYAYVGLYNQHTEVEVLSDGLRIVNGVVQPVAGEPSLGTPHRHTPSVWNVLNNGAQTVFTDINVGPTGLNLVPAGTKSIVLSGKVQGRCTSAAEIFVALVLRPKGSSDDTTYASEISFGINPGVNGTYYKTEGELWVDLDPNCTFQYRTHLVNCDTSLSWLVLLRHFE